jgi:hypothetical protein
MMESFPSGASFGARLSILDNLARRTSTSAQRAYLILAYFPAPPHLLESYRSHLAAWMQCRQKKGRYQDEDNYFSNRFDSSQRVLYDGSA